MLGGGTWLSPPAGGQPGWVRPPECRDTGSQGAGKEGEGFKSQPCYPGGRLVPAQEAELLVLGRWGWGLELGQNQILLTQGVTR